MATEASPTPENSEIFRQLESYSWDTDAEFQGGLSAILGTTSDPSQIQELTIRAQVFYLSRKKSTPIDFDTYKTYLSSKSSQTPPTAANEVSPTVPPNQMTPSTFSPSSNGNTVPPTPTNTESTTPLEPTEPQPISLGTTTSSLSYKPVQAPYPPTFAEIVQLITSGAPIPGIKDIPSTLLTDQATKPVASKRRKPWEKDVPETGDKVEGTFGDRRDEVIVQELPE